MKIDRIIGVIALAGIIAAGSTSCQSTRKYKSPEIETQALFRGENPSDTTTIANIPWQEYFTDPMLRELIDQGLRNNFDLNIAFTRIQQAEANLSIARSSFFPTVALIGQVNHTQLSNGRDGKNILGYPSTNYTLGISSTWEVDIWGKLSAQKRAQYAQFLNSHAYRNLIQTSLIANIATSYYALMALDEQLRVTRENIKLLEKTTESMQAMFDAGLQNRAGVGSTKALLYGTKATIPDLESLIWQTENAISVMLGREPGPIIRGTIAKQTLSPQLDHGVPAQMLAKRPDVTQAELAFRSAFELTNATRSSFYPSITLGTGSMIGYASNSLSQFFKPQNILANLVGGLTQPIFAQKQLRGNLKIAKARQEEALLNFEKTVLGAGQEVSNIVYSYRASLSKNQVRDGQVEAMALVVEDTQELLAQGVVNYLEVITAQQNLLQVQLVQINDKLEQLQYSVNLYKALGGGAE